MDPFIAGGWMCPVCYDNLDDPRLIKCGHTFCAKCLDKLQKLESDKTHLTCPLCCGVAPIPEGDVSKLPRNITVKGMVEGMKTAKLKCTNCDEKENSLAVSYCQNCTEYMCRACTTNHAKWRKKGDHGVVSVDDIKTGKIKIEPKCKKHPNDALMYICKQCKKKICFKCRILVCEKKTHDIIDEGDYTNSVKTMIKKLQKKADSKISLNSKHADNINEQTQKVREVIQARKSEVKKAHDEAAARLAERQRVLLQECDKYESVLLEKLNTLAEKCKEFMLRISNASELVGYGFKTLGTGHVMEAHYALCDRLEDILKMDDPDSSEAIAITKRGEGLYFNKIPDDLYIGNVQVSEFKWKEKTCVKLSRYRLLARHPHPTGGWLLAIIQEESTYIPVRASCNRRC